jgi:excinuclease ABC subunit A
MRQAGLAMELDHISIKGAREHNLKHIDVEIPKKKLVVLTGVSGSGKSSLAFDTLYAEGQRRYVESLSAYARQFLGQMEKPHYDSIRGLSPTISIEQKTTGNNPRSTVGTITEVSDYLRVLFARLGQQYCHQCGDRVQGQTAQQMADELGRLPSGERFVLLAPIFANRKGEHRDVLSRLREQGFTRARLDGSLVQLDGLDALDKRKKHTLEAVIDRIQAGKVERSRLTDSVEQALKLGGGALIVAQEGKPDRLLSESRACVRCKISFPEPSPQAFSFNSPQGMCPDCNGLGTRVDMDPDLIIPDDSLSVDQGGIASWGTDVSTKTGWEHGFRAQMLKVLAIDPKLPIRKLSKQKREQLMYGTGDRRYKIKWDGKNSKGVFQMQWEGLAPRLMRRLNQTHSERARAWYAQFMGSRPCPACKGARLRAESAAVRLWGKTLIELSRMTVKSALGFFGEIQLTVSERQIASEVLKEVTGRLGFLLAVGLEYLSLDRAGPSLSGGESQRIRLASQVGSELTGVIYVLDEPSIGLHQRDNRKLLETLKRMRDIGNTVVAVEHDEDTIREADWVLDFGPGAGVRGGELVHAGTPQSLMDNAKSLTGAYLSGRQRIATPDTRRAARGELVIRGASENNLKDLDVTVPLSVLVAVTGVSGAGKSTLINDILYPALAKKLNGAKENAGAHKSIVGSNALDKVVSIDQKPIGRTPRSNPITYVKVFDEIRDLFAGLPDARARGFKPGRFSFNVKGGRCESCQGDGVRKIEMHFLADVFVRCEACQGKRFNDATLEVKFKGYSIADVLELTVLEALGVFEALPNIAEPLRLLAEVGLDYLHLGQPSPTLSGGEAQRIKLARELSRKATGNTLYVLDEPTTGLHFDDVKKLLGVLDRLVGAGNTVVVIEHNLDVIRCADHVIDLGPEGGPLGGTLVAQGTPEQVARNERSYTGQFLKVALAQHASSSGLRREDTESGRLRSASAG